MKTSTVVILGLVGVAGVGGFLYWQHTKKVAAAVAAKASAKTTTDKIVGSITTLAPVVAGIAKLWS